MKRKGKLSTAERKKKIRRDPGMRFLDEVGRYIRAHGGAVEVAGPVRLVDWPEDAERNATAPVGLQTFAVDVKVLGKRPSKPESA